MGGLRWFVPLIVLLGLLSAMFEGLGLYLVVPLLQSFFADTGGAWADNPILSWFETVLAPLPDEARVPALVAGICASIVMKNVVQYADTLLWAWLEARMNARVQDRMYAGLLAAESRQLDRVTAGSLLNTFEGQSWTAVDALSTVLSTIIEVLAIVFFVVLLLMLSWQMTLIVLVGVVAITAIVDRITRRVERLGYDLVEAEERLSARLLDTLAGLRTIRVFGRERHERGRYSRTVGEVLDAGIRQEVVSAAAGPIVEILAMLLIGALAAVTVVRDPAALPAFASFIIIVQRLMPRAQSLISVRIGLLGDMAAIRNTLSWLDRSDAPQVVSGPHRFDGLETDIRFDTVRFSYGQGDRHALVDVSLEIPRGRITGIVGPSGAGKSTLIDLLCRQYDPDLGAVRVNGKPLPQFDLADWRRNLAVVNQDVHLFNGTIRENIRYGRLDASEAEIVEAAQHACAHDFILERPEGYDLVLNDNGSELSGGQRQRIALARALIRAPDLLILDEATSALDPLSETLVQEALQRRPEGCTVVVIAHRASTIRFAEHLVVLEAGRVVQEGDRETLTAEDGLFQRMFGA